MLSEEYIENLIHPLIERQEAINTYVITQIAKRIKEIGELKSSDVYKLERLFKTGDDVRKINKELARLTGLQEDEIKSIIRDAARTNYIASKPYFDYRQRSFIPFAENAALQAVIAAVQKQTLDTYRNLAKAQAFMIRDLKNPKKLIPTSIAKTYQSVIDEAIQASQSGTIDYNTAMRRTMKQLNESGIRHVEYDPESGRRYSQRLDTAIRRNILDGVRAINQGVQDEIGKQFDADGKELSVHQFSAPDHEPIQGHQFTNEQFDKMQNEEPFEDVNGKKFPAMRIAIGTLNCRHFAFSIIVGFTKPNYTQEQLVSMVKKNNEGYTTKDGKHLTMYECTQYQRKLETKVRKAKDGQIMAREAGDIDLAREYQAKINKYSKQYKVFSKACGLEPHLRNMTVSGYHRISVPN